MRQSFTAFCSVNLLRLVICFELGHVIVVASFFVGSAATPVLVFRVALHYNAKQPIVFYRSKLTPMVIARANKNHAVLKASREGLTD